MVSALKGHADGNLTIYAVFVAGIGHFPGVH